MLGNFEAALARGEALPDAFHTRLVEHDRIDYRS